MMACGPRLQAFSETLQYTTWMNTFVTNEKGANHSMQNQFTANSIA